MTVMLKFMNEKRKSITNWLFNLNLFHVGLSSNCLSLFFLFSFMYKSKDFNPKPQKRVYVSPHGLRSFCHLWLYGPNLDTVIIPGSHSGLTCDPGQVSHCHRAVISFLSELLPHFFLSPARPVVPVISHHHQTRWLSPGMKSTGAGFPGRAHELCVPCSIPSTGWHWAGVQDAIPCLHGSCLPIKQFLLHLCQSFVLFFFFKLW